jgi:hypothetical protein
LGKPCPNGKANDNQAEPDDSMQPSCLGLVEKYTLFAEKD